MPAECVFVLESFYEVERGRVAQVMRAAIALPTIHTLDPATLLRAPEVYEVDRLDFAESYLVAQAETTGTELGWGVSCGPGNRTLALGVPPMRAAADGGRMRSMIETATSVTVIHGAMLSFETVEARDADDAAIRVREHHETLLRVIDGAIMLELDGELRSLMLEGEARIGSGVPHRVWSAGGARIVQEFRRTR